MRVGCGLLVFLQAEDGIGGRVAFDGLRDVYECLISHAEVVIRAGVAIRGVVAVPRGVVVAVVVAVSVAVAIAVTVAVAVIVAAVVFVAVTLATTLIVPMSLVVDILVDDIFSYVNLNHLTLLSL